VGETTALFLFCDGQGQGEIDLPSTVTTAHEGEMLLHVVSTPLYLTAVLCIPLFSAGSIWWRLWKPVESVSYTTHTLPCPRLTLSNMEEEKCVCTCTTHTEAHWCTAGRAGRIHTYIQTNTHLHSPALLSAFL
jgi:hypothetical protein